MSRLYQFFAITFFSALLSAPLQAHGPSVSITLANGEWPPFLGEQLPNYGLGSQVVSRAFALRGVQVNYVFLPWKRALEESRRGRYAGTLLWSLNADRKNSFLVSDPVYRSKTVLMQHSNQPLSWQTLADLKGKTLGVTNGYSYGEQWEALAKAGTFRTDVGNTDLQNLAKLLSQRIDGFPCEAIVCQYLIAQHFPPITRQILTMSINHVHEENMHLLLNKSLPNGNWLMTQFNLGLSQLQRTGELAKLIRNEPVPIPVGLAH